MLEVTLKQVTVIDDPSCDQHLIYTNNRRVDAADGKSAPGAIFGQSYE